MFTTNTQNQSTHTGSVDLPAEEMRLLNRMAARIASLRSLAPDLAQLGGFM